MRNLKKKISALVLSTVFASMQLGSLAAIDTGLGAGNGGAVINNATGGFAGVNGAGTGNVDLNFTGNAHVNWDSLNVNKGESLNFNAINGANGLTILNTVNQGMTTVAGQISANPGIAKLIISNPNGVLFNGATFDAAGDVMLTTQPMTATFVNGAMNVSTVPTASTVGVVTIQDSNFSVGGEFNILAPSIDVVSSTIKANTGLKLITQNGQDYLSAGNLDSTKGVRLEAVNIDGDVYIIADKGIVKTVGGGEINGNLNIKSDDSVALNYVANGKALHVTGDVDVEGNGVLMYARNTKVDGNLNMTNGGGFLEVGNVQVGKDMNLKTIAKSENPQGYKHFVHVVGDNKVGGNATIESEHNIHIGNYNFEDKQLLDGSLEVGGKLTAHAVNGHIMTTVDVKADKISLKSDNLNVLTDGKAVLDANEYEFSSNGYLGGLKASGDTTVDEKVIAIMEGYVPIEDSVGTPGNINITGGTITKIETPSTATTQIASSGDVKLTGADAGKVNITAPGKYIEITGDVTADTINIGRETDKVKVDFPGRDYKLKFTNIKDNEEVTINGNEEITYEITDGEGGNNDGTQIKGENTYLVGPDKEPEPEPTPDPDPEPDPDPTPDPDPEPDPEPTPDPDPEPTPEPTPEPQPEPTPVPDGNENVKVLRSFENQSVNMNQVYTPVAYAADLEDDQNDTGVRKNVDGSVTVVRAFPMDK